MKLTLADTGDHCHPPPDMDPEKEAPGWVRQSPFDLSFDWGPPGVAATASAGGIVVVVDVLRFTTAVEAAVSAGVIVYPYRWRDDTAQSFATSVGALLADSRDASGPSLSPPSLAALPTGSRVVLPSPNGSTCAVTAAEAGATVVAGCLRNASAVASWLTAQALPVTVIAAGERWRDGSLRPAVEDLLGAGAILARLPGSPSPEAAAAAGAFRALSERMPETLAGCASGRELAEKGWAADVDWAAELDSSAVVPVLRNGVFVDAGAR
jgi:2-phosphosulfolactate phosphatase